MNRATWHLLATLAPALLLVPTASPAPAAEQPFRSAKPVWLAGRESEMNLLVGFRAVLEVPQDARPVLRLAASSVYRVWLNGEFLGCGPARGPHGFYRVDEWNLGPRLRPGANLLAIEVAGYNTNSYYLLDQPAFLQAEVTAGDRVLASTAGGGTSFAAQLLTERVQKVARYSFQRPFTEAYRLTPESRRWRMDAAVPFASAELAVQPEKPLLPRRVLQPDFAVTRPQACPAQGRLNRLAQVGKLWKDRSLTQIGPLLKGFPEAELEITPSLELQHWESIHTSDAVKLYDAHQPTDLAAGQYQILDLGTNLTGFLGVTVECRQNVRLWMLFDEILDEKGDVNFRRMGCVNVVAYDLQPGTYSLESIEPYTMRYVKLVCMEGACRVSNVLLRQYSHPPTNEATFVAGDERLNRLYAAAVQTFRQNTLDVFMDCPSRERAGWLCDSYFTARVAADLTGTTRVEDAFIENFLLPPQFAGLPEGMFPMCYPSDHPNGNFIPNWAMWLVLELDEYAARGGDPQIVEAMRPKVLKLLDYFRPFENSDGLLEKLQRWVFVEWSAANKYVQDVNYPSNMLYAGMLSATARLYQLPDLEKKAEAIRQTVRRQSFDGQFFVDNAVRRNGKLEVTRNRTEVCQYFAFYFGVADRQRDAALWQVLRDEFGPSRKEKGLYPDVGQANSFIGNVLRMELLSQAGRNQQILDESIAYLLYMADRTGTLWENVDTHASCNHGFASHAIHTFYRDVLGLYLVDPVARRIQIRIGDLNLQQCEGTRPTPAGPVHLSWQRRGDEIQYRLQRPAGYQVTVENLSGRRLVEVP
jgi:alpha-L-rhamnosidase